MGLDQEYFPQLDELLPRASDSIWTSLSKAEAIGDISSSHLMTVCAALKRAAKWRALNKT